MTVCWNENIFMQKYLCHHHEKLKSIVMFIIVYKAHSSSGYSNSFGGYSGFASGYSSVSSGGSFYSSGYNYYSGISYLVLLLVLKVPSALKREK